MFGELQIAFFGNFQRGGQRFRRVRKQLIHFRGRFEIQFMRRHFHAARVVERLAGGNAEVDVVRLPVLFFLVVAVIGSHDGQTQLFGRFL